MPTLRRTSLAAAALLTVPAAMFIGATSASAAGYDGQDPTGTPCANDARTVASANLTYGSSSHGVIELRYSPSCRTTWARVYGVSKGSPGDSAGGSARVIRNDGHYHSCSVSSGSDCHTAMVSDAGYTSYAHGEYDTGNVIYRGNTTSY